MRFIAKYDGKTIFKNVKFWKARAILWLEIILSMGCRYHQNLYICREWRNMDDSTCLFSRKSLPDKMEKRKLSVKEQYIDYLEKLLP